MYYVYTVYYSDSTSSMMTFETEEEARRYMSDETDGYCRLFNGVELDE